MVAQDSALVLFCILSRIQRRTQKSSNNVSNEVTRDGVWAPGHVHKQLNMPKTYQVFKVYHDCIMELCMSFWVKSPYTIDMTTRWPTDLKIQFHNNQKGYAAIK